MSPEEAAAQADALIAQHRATAPRRKRAVEPRVEPAPRSKGAFGASVNAFVLVAIGFVAGYQWHAARPGWSVLTIIVGIGFAVVLGRRLHSENGSSNGEAQR